MAFGGKPTRPAVEELLRSFNPEPGSSVERRLIRDIILKVEPRADDLRVRTCVDAWRKDLLRVNKLDAKPSGDRIHFLNAEQALRNGFGLLTKGSKAIFRAEDYANGYIDPLALKEETDKAALINLRRGSKAASDAARSAVKDTKAPLSVSGNPRLKLVNGDKA